MVGEAKMSAFMVGSDHIDYLVTAVRQFIPHAYDKIHYGNPTAELDLTQYTDTELGRLLLGTNLRSMQARYPGSLSPDEMGAVEAYRCRRWSSAVTHIQGLKAVACYEYQSCEFDGWEQSAAHALVVTLHHSIIRTFPGYADAQYEVTRPVAVDNG